MQVTQAQPATQSAQRYYISGKVMRPRVLTIVGILAGVPLLLKLIGEEVDALLFGVFGVLIILTLLLVWYVTRTTWIEMDASGIVYKGWGFRVATTWDNVASIGTRYMVNEGTVEGLLLVENALDVNGVVQASSWLSWQGTMALRALENFIPLSNFQTKEWRDTPFGQDIRRHAPRLFKDER